MTATANSRRGLWRGQLWVGNAILGVLAVLAPFAAFVAIRIGLVRTCVGFNTLGLPWHPVLSTAVMTLGILVVIASFAMIVIGFCTPGMRIAAAAAILFGVLSAVPVLIVLFANVYGEFGGDCIPY
jgi:hypothetical protein